MDIGILGTGTVGRDLARRLQSIGHKVIMGTRDPDTTRQRTNRDAWGNPSFQEWYRENSDIKLTGYTETADAADLVILALPGSVVLEVIEDLPKSSLVKKIIWDITNPLDFSKGMPPSLFVCNTDSLGEQVQKALPDSFVVKTLNTITAPLMVEPKNLISDHTIFIAGNDTDAKQDTKGYLKGWFGWTDVMDLGDISQSRGTEMFLPLWLSMMNALGTPVFGIKVVR